MAIKYSEVPLVELENEYTKITGKDRIIYRIRCNEFRRWVEITDSKDILEELQSVLLADHSVLSFIDWDYENINSDNIIHTMRVYSFCGETV